MKHAWVSHQVTNLTLRAQLSPTEAKAVDEGSSRQVQMASMTSGAAEAPMVRVAAAELRSAMPTWRVGCSWVCEWLRAVSGGAAVWSLGALCIHVVYQKWKWSLSELCTGVDWPATLVPCRV